MIGVVFLDWAWNDATNPSPSVEGEAKVITYVLSQEDLDQFLADYAFEDMVWDGGDEEEVYDNYLAFCDFAEEIGVAPEYEYVVFANARDAEGRYAKARPGEERRFFNMLGCFEDAGHQD